MQKISLKQKNNKLSTKTKVIIVILTVLISALVSGYWIFLNNYHEWSGAVIEPTCTEKGYTQYTCKYCNRIKRTRYTAALGHDYGETVLKTQATETDFGKRARVCKRCKKEEVYLIEPTSTMKKLYFVGDAFAVDSDMTTEGVLTYSHNGKKEESYVYLKYTDGNNTRYAKHNYTITLYKDSDKTEEKYLKLTESDEKNYKWCLAGNYYDFGNLRSVVADRLYRQVRSTSTSADKRLGENFGTVESEPVLFYVNNTFAGIHRLYKPVDNTTFNAKKGEKLAVVRASYTSRESLFKLTTDETGPWRIIYNYLEPEDGDEKEETSENSEWIWNSLNRLINFVSEKEGKEFKDGISDYLDVDGMIDYMVTVYNTCSANNVSKYFTLATYDGKIWTPTIYNASASFGLNNHGEITNLEKTLVPSEDDDGEYDSDTASLLWDKMLNSFYDEISKRYTELRDTVFSSENILREFNNLSVVSETVLNREKEAFKQVDYETNITDNINSFISSRRTLLGEFFK